MWYPLPTYSSLVNQVIRDNDNIKICLNDMIKNESTTVLRQRRNFDNLNFDMLRFLLNIVSNTSWPPSVHAEPCFGQLVLLLSGLQSYLTFGESTVHLPAPISVKGNIVGWWWQLS